MHMDDDTFYELVGNERRRACLKQLRDGREWAVSDLARAVASEIAEPGSDPAEMYDSVYISLCQNHLPRLDTVSLIEYDREAKILTSGDEFGEIERRLWDTTDTGPTAALRLVAISGVTVVLVAASVLAPSVLDSYLLALVLLMHIGVLFVVASSKAGDHTFR